jgi:hypothetical protein
MVEGFWIVQFEGVQGNGGGVIVFLKNHVFGGDGSFTYTGTYETDEKAISGRVLVHNFLPGVASVLGVQGDVELVLKGAVNGTNIRAVASVVNQGIAGLTLKLTKVRDLPQ